MEIGCWPTRPCTSDLINRLEELKAEHGDLPITYELLRGGVNYADVSKFRVVYVGSREKREQIWSYRIGEPEDGDLKVLKF